MTDFGLIISELGMTMHFVCNADNFCVAYENRLHLIDPNSEVALSDDFSPDFSIWEKRITPIKIRSEWKNTTTMLLLSQKLGIQMKEFTMIFPNHSVIIDYDGRDWFFANQNLFKVDGMHIVNVDSFQTNHMLPIISATLQRKKTDVG